MEDVLGETEYSKDKSFESEVTTSGDNGLKSGHESVEDPAVKCHLIIQLIEESEEFDSAYNAINALKSCAQSLADGLDSDDDTNPLRDQLMAKISEIDFYTKVGQLTGLRSWKDAKHNLNGFDILTIIKTKRKYGLAVDWFKIHGWDAVTSDLQFDLLVLAYCEQKDLTALTQLLLTTEQIEVNIVSSLEKLVNNICDFDLRAFVIEFILTHFISRLNDETIVYYKNYMTGIELLKGLDSKFHNNYVNIMTKPLLIVEQMLMNLECEALEEATKILNFDHLLEVYAQKAVEIQIYDLPSTCGSVVSDATLISSTFLDNKSTPKVFLMPESVPTKEQWIPDSNVTHCMLCRYEKFSMLNRRHHCRRCGRVVCGNCSQNSLMISEVKSNSMVRVCDECYIQMQSRRDSFSSDVSSLNKREIWVLSSDDLHNDSIRMEFYYDSSPSVTLCLALLKLHSDKSRCCKVIVDLICKPLLETVVSSQVDNGLVIGMIRSLLVSTRISVEEQKPELKESINFLLNRLDVIRMLINSNCITKELISYALSNKDNSIVRLQEKLIEMERFELGRDLATKFGLDPKSIFKTWAFQCLKHSHFSDAREKFKRAFDKKTTEVNRDLENIVNVLSKRKYWSNSSVRETCLQITKGQLNSNVQTSASVLYTDSSHDLQSKNPIIFAEILYYLKEYGSNEDIIKFYIKQSMFKRAVHLFLNYSHLFSNNFFMKEIFMPSVRKGCLSTFLRELSSCDPSLNRVWKSLLAACKYLSSNDMYHVLHVLQVFMGDHLRAAITQINCFFLSPPAVDYMELFARIECLQTAKQHCNDFLNLNLNDYRNGCLIMERDSVMRQIRALNIQIDITIRFNQKRIKGFLPNDVISDTGKGHNTPPTILDHNKARVTELTALTIISYGSQIAEGFSISQMMIKDHNLDAAQVYRLAGRSLARLPGINVLESVSQLIECIRVSKTGDTTVCDDVIGACVRNSYDSLLMDNLIKMLSNDVNKIDAYIRNDKLKSAYLLASKENRVTDVLRVLEAAKRLNNKQMTKICELWLKKKKQLPTDN